MSPETNHTQMASTFFWLTSVLLISLADASTAKPFYTAAVFEHSRFGRINDSVEVIIGTNLELYRKAAIIAKNKGTDIIVFPEYGIFLPDDRQKVKIFLENIPEPRYIYTNPCKEKEIYSQRPILHSLSCIARSNYMFVVANMGDIQNCEGDSNCPTDGVFHFNTNVVFDRSGTLILKYHKEHLFFEFGMDLARKQQDPTFETDFGKFATFTSFDILFQRMGDVAQWPSVDGIMFPTMWVDFTPQLISVPFWQAWAMGNNATLFASNVHIPGYYAVGSGVFSGKSGAVAHTYNPDGLSKLIVATIAKRGYPEISADTSVTAVDGDDSWDHKNDGKHVKMECSRQVLNDTLDIFNEHRCVEENTSNYTFEKLSKRSGHVEVCNNGMCCSLDYTRNKVSENFYLGVYNGTYTSFSRYFRCEENCILARCEAVGNNSCATFPVRSKTIFHQVQLRANFTTQYVYPSVVQNGMRLLPRNEWKYSQSTRESTINFKSQTGRNLILVGFKGRCYDRDPPYKR